MPISASGASRRAIRIRQAEVVEASPHYRWRHDVQAARPLVRRVGAARLDLATTRPTAPKMVVSTDREDMDVRGGLQRSRRRSGVRRAHVHRTQGRIALAAGPDPVRHRRERVDGSRRHLAGMKPSAIAHPCEVLHPAAEFRQPAAGQAWSDRRANRAVASDGVRFDRRRKTWGGGLLLDERRACPTPTASRQPTV